MREFWRRFGGLAGALETDQVSAVEQAVDALSEQVSQSTVERRLADAMELVHPFSSPFRRGVTLDAEDLYDEAGLPR